MLKHRTPPIVAPALTSVPRLVRNLYRGSAWGVSREKDGVERPQEIGNDLANTVAEELGKLTNNRIKIHVE